MWGCNISILNQWEISHNRHLRFDDCDLNAQDDVFAIFSKNRIYKPSSFMRTYFSSINCACLWTATDVFCLHCLRLKNVLNYNVSKICIRGKDLAVEFHLMKINEYFERKLCASYFLYHCEEQNLSLSKNRCDWLG